MRKRQRRPVVHSHAGCGKHPLESASEICASCHRRCCPRCVVLAGQRVLCIDCSLVIAGIVPKRRAYH